MKKIIALLLALSAMLLFAGCGDSGNTPAEDTAAPETTDTAAPEEEQPATVTIFNADAADSDLVILKLDGRDVMWEEFAPWLHYSYSSYVGSYGEIEDMSAVADEESGKTYADFITGRAVGMMRYYKSIEANTEELGITLSEENIANIDSGVAEQRAEYDSDEEYDAFVVDQFGSPELYRYLLEMTQCYKLCFNEQYGENGEKLTPEDVIEYVAEDGYMMAKHILIKTVDDENNPLPDDEKSKLLNDAESIVAELEALPTREEKNARFDEIMNERSEDGGLAIFPDGYLFTPGEMVAEFENAVLALDEYEISGVVETNYGYHIIMRLPINVDVTPNAYSMYVSYGMEYPLRLMVAENMFAEVVTSWGADVTVESAEGFDTLDLSAIFTQMPAEDAE